MHDHAVATQRELIAHRRDAASGGANGGPREPVVWDERCRVLQLFGGAHNIEAANRTHHFIGEEAIDNGFVPTVCASK